MMKHYRIWRACALVGLLALGAGLTGATGSASAMSGSTPRTTSGASSHTSHTTSKPIVVTGTWIYKDSTSREVLHLRQGKHGGIQGDGTADRTVSHKSYHSVIYVNKGRWNKSTLNLQLYLTQVNWGSGLTAVENLSCTAAARVLHCRMDMPLYKIHNVKQDFSLHA